LLGYACAHTAFQLDCSKIIFLDAEDLAEAAIKRQFQDMQNALRGYISHPLRNLPGLVNLTIKTFGFQRCATPRKSALHVH